MPQTYSRKIERYKNDQCPQCGKSDQFRPIHRAWTNELIAKNCDNCKISWKFDTKKNDVVVNWDWEWPN